MLREQADPPITVRALAEALQMSGSAYHNYESDRRYKGKFLPMDFARKVARVLKDRGVDPEHVLALAGVGLDAASTPAGLSPGQERWLEIFDDLTPRQRKLLVQMAEEMRAPEREPDDTTLHAPAIAYTSEARR